jgi:hypothetical protein
MSDFQHSYCTKVCKGMCCSNCGPEHGWLKVTTLRNYTPNFHGDDYALFRYLKDTYGWSQHAGFRTPTGCRLPRHERSHTCTSYRCGRPELTPGALT